MAVITERLLGERQLVLGPEQFMRPFSFGDTWQQVRVGVRYTLGHPPANANHSMFIGVCSGSKGWFDPDCHILGWFFGPIVTVGFPHSVTYTYNAVSPPNFSASTNNARAVARVGGTNVLSTNNISFTAYHPVFPRMQHWGVYINRTTPGSPVLNWLLTANSSDTNDYTQAQFLAFLEGQANINTAAANSTPTYTVPPNKPLDTIYFANWWEIPKVILSDIGIARLS